MTVPPDLRLGRLEAAPALTRTDLLAPAVATFLAGWSRASDVLVSERDILDGLVAKLVR